MASIEKELEELLEEEHKIMAFIEKEFIEKKLERFLEENPTADTFEIAEYFFSLGKKISES